MTKEQAASDRPGHAEHELSVLTERALPSGRDALAEARRAYYIGVLAVNLPEVIVPGATLADIERHAILVTLRACGGRTSEAAKVLQISARKIQYKLHDYGIAPSPMDCRDPHASSATKRDRVEDDASLAAPAGHVDAAPGNDGANLTAMRAG